ncbi:MAG: family 16 glycoside hydrolase [Armatimonadota bacterium]
MKKIRVILLLLAASVLATSSAVAADMQFTFENPPYTIGSIDGQDAWRVDSWPNPADVHVTNVSPISGSQSLLINDADGYGVAHHSLAGQSFADGTAIRWRIKVTSSESHVSLSSTTGIDYLWAKFSPQENVIRVAGSWGGSYKDIGPCAYNHVYEALFILYFSTHNCRAFVKDITDPEQPILDSGLLALEPGTTAGNAAGEMRLWGIGEARFDDVEFLQQSKELYTTNHFMTADYGMQVLSAQDNGDNTITVDTTAAGFLLARGTSDILLTEDVPVQRETALIQFSDSYLSDMQVQKSTSGATVLGSAKGQIKIQSDSSMIIKPSVATAVTINLRFSPMWSATDYSPNYLLLDMKGGIGVFPKGQPASVDDQISTNNFVRISLNAGQELMISACPPRAYPWQKSFDDRVMVHYTGDPAGAYPSDSQIATYTPFGNILILTSDAQLWENWWLGFEPRQGPSEVHRVIDAAHANGLKLVIYVSPAFFVKGTSREDEARSRVPKAGETDINTITGENADIFLFELQRLYDRFHPDGFYFDGLYPRSLVNSYYFLRKTREMIGDNGMLIVHSSESPPREWSYLRCPSVDTYADFILRGEREYQMFGEPEDPYYPDYLRCWLSTYNISNSIGVMLQSEEFATLPSSFIERVLNNNLRLFAGVTAPNLTEQLNNLQNHYWPRLNSQLTGEVDAADALRVFPEYSNPIPPNPMDMFRDDFSAGSGNWQIDQDQWTVTDGALTNAGTTGSAIAVAGNAFWKNYTFQARVKIRGHVDPVNVPWSSVYILARYQDANNYYRFGMHGDIRALNLLKCVNGQWTELVRWEGFRPKPNQWYTLKLTVNGDRIRGYVDGALAADVRDSSIVTGKVGLHVPNDIRASYDDVVVMQENSSFGFENPPYSVGALNGQDGWSAVSGSPSLDVTGSDPLAGSQSAYVNDAVNYRKSKHSLADVAFAEGTILKWLVKVSSKESLVYLYNTSGASYMWAKFSAQQKIIRVGDWAGTYKNLGPCVASHLYEATCIFYFSTHKYRITVKDLTEPTRPIMDSGLLGTDANTTTTNARGEIQLWGIGEARFDNIEFGYESALSGLVDLKEFAGDRSLAPVKIELIRNGNVMRTESVSLDCSGNYFLPAVTPGTYDVAFSACKWLRKVVSGVNASLGGTGIANASLDNGDMDGDNNVTSTDLNTVLSNMDKTGD